MTHLMRPSIFRQVSNCPSPLKSFGHFGKLGPSKPVSHLAKFRKLNLAKEQNSTVSKLSRKSREIDQSTDKGSLIGPPGKSMIFFLSGPPNISLLSTYLCVNVCYVCAFGILRAHCRALLCKAAFHSFR